MMNKLFILESVSSSQDVIKPVSDFQEFSTILNFRLSAPYGTDMK